MKYEQKSFSVGYTPGPAPEPPCPLCPLPEGLEKGHARVWKLCKAHREEFAGEQSEASGDTEG